MIASRYRLATMGATLVAISLLLAEPASAQSSRRDAQRADMDANAAETMDRLFAQSDQARRLYESAYGYAAFNVIKVSLAVTGGGGRGVAINKTTGERTYMRMGTGGLNFGLGGQKYQLVFLFEDEATFNGFVNNGWEAGASANAVAGRMGANAGTSFINGVAVYQLTDAGLMLQFDISGTRYWPSRRHN